QVPPVIVAWDGMLPPHTAEAIGYELRGTEPLPPGYHQLTHHVSGKGEPCTVISAPVQAWRRPGSHRSWGVGTHLAALRSARSRSLGDLKDLQSLCRWVRERGGDLVTVLPLLP